MQKVTLYAAFSISTTQQFDSWLLKDLKVQGFSKVAQWGMWANSEGKIYEEPSYQYIFFGLTVEKFDRINRWFEMSTIEESLLWEENNQGKFVDLRQNQTDPNARPWDGMLANPNDLLESPVSIYQTVS